MNLKSVKPLAFGIRPNMHHPIDVFSKHVWYYEFKIAANGWMDRKEGFVNLIGGDVRRCMSSSS